MEAGCQIKPVFAKSDGFNIFKKSFGYLPSMICELSTQELGGNNFIIGDT